jgi:hypothetical protein
MLKWLARYERVIRTVAITAVSLLALVRATEGDIGTIGYTVTGCLLVGLLAVTEHDPNAHRF